MVGLVGVTSGGCVWERLDHRPARMQLGVNSRHLEVATPVADPLPGRLARTTAPTPTPTPETPSSSAVTGSLQFTMGLVPHVYVGGEVEFGTLGRLGSNLGGAYGVVGAEATSSLGSLSIEAAAGPRWTRYELGSEDVRTTPVETRVRGQLWLSPQVTLGGVLGANAVPGERGWIAGIYVGVFSNLFGTGK